MKRNTIPTTSFYRTRVGANGEDVPHRDIIQLFDKVSKEVMAELATVGRSDEFHGFKIIYSAMRFITCEELEWFLNNCIELKQEFPDMIAGVIFMRLNLPHTKLIMT